MANGQVSWDPCDILQIPPRNHRHCMSSESCSGSLDAADLNYINQKLTEMPLLNPSTIIQEPSKFLRLATALLCQDHQQNTGTFYLWSRWKRAIEGRYSWTLALAEEADDDCPVGFDELKIGEQVTRCQECKKYFHGTCVVVYLKQTGTCPCWYVFLTIGMVH